MKKTICFTGSRPNNLYGYDTTKPEYKKLKTQLKEAILKEIENGTYELTAISGGALGVDTFAFEVVQEIKDLTNFTIFNQLAVPFEKQYTAWLNKDQNKYFQMKAKANKIFYVDIENNDINPGEYSKEKLMNRNRWMVDNSDVVIAVYRIDKIKDSRGTQHCINYALKQGKRVIKVEL